MTLSLTARIANFALMPARDIPDSARDVMRLSLLDWAAVGIAGQDEPVARITRDMALAEAGRPVATVIGSAMRLPPRAAALVNGATSHALDYDDTHFAHIGHPSVAVVPAALAMAEQTGATGAAFLDAALIGVETSIRVGAWLGRAHYQTGFHQTGTAGAFGATAAACRLLGLDATRTAHALGLVATRASGLKSQFGTMGKPFNAGIAASNGVEAALLAGAGFVSNPRGIETAQGFGPTHAGEAIWSALDGLGTRFLFETVQHKFHACCHGTHAALEALAALKAQGGNNEVTGVTITTHSRWLTVCNVLAPVTGLEAKFSYRLTAAMMLSGYDTGALETFSDALCADPALCALRDRVEVKTDDAMAETACLVRLDHADGTSKEQFHDLDTPMPLAARRDKIRAKARSLLGRDRESAVWSAVESGDLALFTTSLRP
ncbi:MmgE/PrpD family protein [Pseudogemmobacter sp. W21_MBD1_M6]|uniref:MmgE/PrpD family protein n=1 Tax=Pseudogemmobacter sp. W21_MBD1_M6 TaxID=3240271 RepID=UPI003F99521D